MAKVHKNYIKPKKRKQSELTTARAVATRNIKARQPDDAIDIAIRDEDKRSEMVKEYVRLHKHFVEDPWYDKDKYFTGAVDDHRSEYTRGRMTKKAVDAVKRLNKLPDRDTFRNMSEEEQAKYFLEIREIVKDMEVKGSTYIRPELEHVRAQWMHTNNLSPETQKYLRGGDLRTIDEYLRFLDMAKTRTGQYANAAYFIGMEDYYDDIHKSTRFTSDEKQLLAFIKFQLECAHGDERRVKQLLKKASNLKVGGHYVFSRQYIEDYL